jgi:hypothetical protein
MSPKDSKICFQTRGIVSPVADLHLARYASGCRFFLASRAAPEIIFAVRNRFKCQNFHQKNTSVFGAMTKSISREFARNGSVLRTFKFCLTPELVAEDDTFMDDLHFHCQFVEQFGIQAIYLPTTTSTKLFSGLGPLPRITKLDLYGVNSQQVKTLFGKLPNSNQITSLGIGLAWKVASHYSQDPDWFPIMKTLPKRFPGLKKLRVEFASRAPGFDRSSLHSPRIPNMMFSNQQSMLA